MGDAVRILAFAGSTRQASHNKRFIRVAAAAVEQAGGSVTSVDLHDYAMPLYDGDLEAANGLPQGAQRLRALMRAHDGYLIASPEYNAGMTGVLKNTIDWTSRPIAGEPGLACYAGKVVGLISASPGALGGLRGLAQVRAVLTALRVVVIPEQVALPHAAKAFGDDGTLIDTARQSAIDAMASRLVTVAAKLRP